MLLYATVIANMHVVVSPHSLAGWPVYGLSDFSQTLKERLAPPEAKAAGAFINTMGWVDGMGYQLLVHSAKALGVNVILVLGQDRLHSELEQEFRKSDGVDVVGGVPFE